MNVLDKNFSDSKIPEHISIIMDGNGRWAKKNSLPRISGHKEGIGSVRAITKQCDEIGIKYLSLYTFSSENWKRPRSEVKALMRLLLTTIRHEIKDLNKNNVRLMTIGNLNDLPDDAKKGMEEGLELTKTLSNYAETGSDYIKILEQIIVQNKLMDFEPVRLANSMNKKQLDL